MVTAQVVLVRELTKIYEEYQRGTISELLEASLKRHLGECLLIVEGASQDVEEKMREDLFSRNTSTHPARHEEKQAIKEVAKHY